MGVHNVVNLTFRWGPKRKTCIHNIIQIFLNVKLYVYVFNQYLMGHTPTFECCLYILHNNNKIRLHKYKYNLFVHVHYQNHSVGTVLPQASRNVRSSATNILVKDMIALVNRLKRLKDEMWSGYITTFLW